MAYFQGTQHPGGALGAFPLADILLILIFCNADILKLCNCDIQRFCYLVTLIFNNAVI